VEDDVIKWVPFTSYWKGGEDNSTQSAIEEMVEFNAREYAFKKTDYDEWNDPEKKGAFFWNPFSPPAG
jgi:hypothetical protein